MGRTQVARSAEFAAVRLSSPTTVLMFHLVFQDCWDGLGEPPLGERVKNCVVQKAKCNTEGNF
ncbi:hypothetical protein [Actinoplanes solisilvae]|uniref:hypothetical protein n=1 Tax=Actinoplanes solisilvae TaxID=2486853 RepID=UPI000FDC07E0|nr:hypothetical protein [Actinoplanes solisilvae]